MNNKKKGSLDGYCLCCSSEAVYLGDRLIAAAASSEMGRFCVEVWVLRFGGSALLSAGLPSRPVSCLEPVSGLAGQTHQLASHKPQEVASVEKKKGISSG